MKVSSIGLTCRIPWTAAVAFAPRYRHFNLLEWACLVALGVVVFAFIGTTGKGL